MKWWMEDAPALSEDCPLSAWHNAMQPVGGISRGSDFPEDAEQGLMTRSPLRVRVYGQLAARAREICAEITAKWREKDLAETLVARPDFRDIVYKPINDFVMLGGSARKLVIVFDEAANLSHQLLYWIRKLMMAFSGLPVWTIFLSTNNQMAKLFPPLGDEITSERLSERQLTRSLTISGLELDLREKELMLCDESRAKELTIPVMDYAKCQHLCLFGRPLWKLHEGDCAKAQQFAERKLLCGNFSRENRHQAFALIANRINLDPVVGPISVELASNAVNSHLRVFVQNDPDSGFMRTITPSEPLVSDAAAMVLMARSGDANHGNPRNWVKCIDLLASQLLGPGLIEKRSNGELFARLVLILARDYTVAPIQLSDELAVSQVCFWSRPVKVLEFLKTLLPSEDYRTLLEYSPGASQPTFADAFKTAHINLTHFTTTSKNIDPEDTPELLHDLLRRCAGLQCGHEQPAWDIVVPVYFGDVYEKFDIAKLSAMAVQVKNKHQASKLEIKEPTTRAFMNLARDIPLLAVLVDLGTEREPLQTAYYGGKSRPGCYGFALRGHGHDTFDVLKHGGLAPVCDRLMKEMKVANSINAGISLRNIRFNRHSRTERYERYRYTGE
jgi:hypothetical protein